MHLIKQNIADPLAEIVDLSSVNGIYIDNPTFKDKDKVDYRLISLLSNINKIIEKVDILQTV